MEGTRPFAVLGLPPQRIALLADALESESRRKSLIERYEFVLSALECTPISRDDPIYVSAFALIQLRHHLTHFDGRSMRVATPAGKPVPQRDRHKIERILCGKFPRSKFSDAESPFFPDQCLGATCAHWACIASFRFVRQFSRNLGVLERHFLRILNEGA